MAGASPERRKAALELIRELAQIMGKTKKMVDEIEEEIVDAVEEAVGVPLTPEKRLLLNLYRFRSPGQLRPSDLKKLIAKYMALGEGEDVFAYLKKLGGLDTGSHGDRGKKPTRSSP